MDQMIYIYDIMIKGCKFAHIYLKLFVKNECYIEFLMIRCYVIHYKNRYELHRVFCMAVTN